MWIDITDEEWYRKETENERNKDAEQNFRESFRQAASSECLDLRKLDEKTLNSFSQLIAIVRPWFNLFICIIYLFIHFSVFCVVVFAFFINFLWPLARWLLWPPVFRFLLSLSEAIASCTLMNMCAVIENGWRDCSIDVGITGTGNM